MKSDMVEKRILLVDGEALEGLIAVDQYELAEGTQEVPGPDRTVTVKNGVTLIPAVNMTFKITRDSRTLQVLQDWKNNNQYLNCTMIRTDGAGNEYSRELWPNTECSRLSGPAYDAGSPAIATEEVTLLPENIVAIAPV